jgi:tellurite methyltransferase
MPGESPYDRRYREVGSGFYWGTKPSILCRGVLDYLPPPRGARPSLIDLGCGEGRNAVYLGAHGYQVTGLDLSEVGLAKAREYAAHAGVDLVTIQADLRTCRLLGTYDVVFSTGTLHYLAPELREERFRHLKECTSPHGLHAVSAFVDKPFIPRAPDAAEEAVPFRSGELMGYYADWEILHSSEEVFDCLSGGVPHQHAVCRVLARRYQG